MVKCSSIIIVELTYSKKCKFDVFFSRWDELISLAKERDQLLKGAEQVHKFVRDASETNDRMNEKVSAFTSQKNSIISYRCHL